MKREFYRIITPRNFSNLDYETLEQAKQGLIRFGSDPSNEYYESWQERMKQCKIVKVTEIYEDIEQTEYNESKRPKRNKRNIL